MIGIRYIFDGMQGILVGMSRIFSFGSRPIISTSGLWHEPLVVWTYTGPITTTIVDDESDSETNQHSEVS